jgi:uncharacterized protein YjbI with pentapeptide repeats
MASTTHMFLRCLERFSISERQQAIDELCSSQTDFELRDDALNGCDLTGLDLMRVEFRGVDFRGCVCRMTTFPPLVECNFDGVDARDACFTRLKECNFRNAVLDGATFGPSISHCNFTGASLRAARVEYIPQLPVTMINYGHVIFDNADLRRFDGTGGLFPTSSFVKTNLSEARLSRAQLVDCNISHATFSGANLTGASFKETDVSVANFERTFIDQQDVQLFMGDGRSLTRFKTVTPPPEGSGLMAFERTIAGLEEIEVRWSFVEREKRLRETVVLRKYTGQQLEAGVFSAKRLIRRYCLHHTGNLHSLLADMFYDYVGWEVDTHSVVVEAANPDTATDLAVHLRMMLGEIFPVTLPAH